MLINEIAVPKFVHEEALAYELAAHFYLELGETDKSVEYFLLAHERYQDWVSSKADLFHMRLNLLLLIFICSLLMSTRREQLGSAIVCLIS